jgi:hypothetical protein
MTLSVECVLATHSIAPFEIVYEDMTSSWPRLSVTWPRSWALRCRRALGRSVLGCAARPTITPNVSLTGFVAPVHSPSARPTRPRVMARRNCGVAAVEQEDEPVV